MSELKDLIKQPKTLRSMKHTFWSSTDYNWLDCEFNDYYIKIKASNNEEFYEIQKELNNAVINRLELSEELLSKFEFSKHSNIINYTNEWYKCMEIVFNDIICLMRDIGRFQHYTTELFIKNEVKFVEDIEVINKTIEDNENKLKDLKIEYGYMEKRAFGGCGLVPTGFDVYLNNECKIINRETGNFTTKYACCLLPTEFAEYLNNECKIIGSKTGNFTLKRLIGKQQFIKIITHGTKKPHIPNADRDYEHSIKYATEKKNTYETYKEYYNNNENYDIPINRILIKTNIFQKKGFALTYYKKKIDNTLFIEQMFNITIKRMKALFNKENVKKGDKYLTKYIRQTDFRPYEESGIECLFVKTETNYNSNYNIIKIEGLKSAYSENMCNRIWCDKKNKYVKIKDIKNSTKKNDIIKALMKL